MKKLIIFDLDGTLAESKSPLDAEMAALLQRLLGIVKVAVISGGGWPQFQQQLLADLPADERLADLSLLSTCGTRFYQYVSDWKLLYAEDFTTEEKAKITHALQQVKNHSISEPAQVWGEIIEDRESQITFSALGQEAPIEAKETWDPDYGKRQLMKAELNRLIPEFYLSPHKVTALIEEARQ